MLILTPPTSPRPSLLEGIPYRLGQPPGLGDREVARVGTGTGDDVADELRSGLVHADVAEPSMEEGKIGFIEGPEDDVLTIGETHVGVELTLDGSQGPETGHR